MSSNPILYTSRTFNTIMNDINSDPELVDKPDWWKRTVAGIGDALGMCENAQANNTYLRTAFTRRAVKDLLQLIDYVLSNRSTSSGTLTFYINRSKTFPLTFTRSELTAVDPKSSLTYGSRAGITLSAQVTEAFTTDYTSGLLTVSGSYVTGDLFRVSSSGSLPSPLQADTDYWVIRVSATKIKLATTIERAFAGTSITLTDNGTGTHTLFKWSFQVDAYQERVMESFFVGTSDGSMFQTFWLSHLDILEDTIVVTVGGLSGWTAVDTFVNGTDSSQNYRVYYDSKGSCSIEFGDGVYAEIPIGDIYAQYSVGGGPSSNVSVLNRISNYSGGSSDLSGVTNTSAFTGGGDFEDISRAKRLAPMSLKTNDRFVTVDDGQVLCLNYGGVSKAKVNKNTYGPMSAQVVIVPNGGGLPSSALKTSLQAYLISRSILDSADIRVEDPTYVTANVVASMKLKTGYVWSNVLPFFTLACRLFFSEMGYEIQSAYISNGIAYAVDMINTKWGTAFTTVDFSKIERLISEDSFFPIDFAEVVTASMALGYIQDGVEGCAYWTLTTPSLPVTLGANALYTDGTMTLSEIV